MPPRKFSRHALCFAYSDTSGNQVLSAREPFEYRNLADTVQHEVVEGDTLYSLAARYYAPHPEAAQLWWVIADFQPVRIVDPTIRLTPGDVLFIPSLRTITEQVFGEAQRLKTQA